MNLKSRQLGKYELLERLGQGGMAEVFKAFQPNIERFVAIKVMHKHLATQDEFVERFCYEAKGMAQLRHHNIVRIIDFEIEDDIYYLVLDYIEGQTLRAHLKQHTILPPCEALYIMAQLADALVYAHEQGIIHRDIKPGNIMFMDDSLSSPVLTDFGLVRILGEDGMTVTGAMIGTPAYMSPEALRGEEIDARGDIYSLGVVLYEMVVGRTPYSAESPYGMILKQLHDPLPAPREVNPDLPEVVEQLLKRAMAKERKERFQSASELYQAIQDAFASLTDGQYIPTSLTKRLNNRPSPKIPNRKPSEPTEKRRFISLSGALGASLIIAFLTVQLLLASDDKKQKISHTSLVTVSTPMRTLTVAELEQMGIALADASATTAPTAEARDDVTSQVAPATATPLNKVPATSTPSGQNLNNIQATEVPLPPAPAIDSVVPQESAMQEPTQTAAATATQMPQSQEVPMPIEIEIEAVVPPEPSYKLEAADNNSDESQRPADKEDEENKADNSANNGPNGRADGGANHDRDEKKDGAREDEDKKSHDDQKRR